MLPPCCKSSSPAASGSALKSRCCCCCCYYCLSVCLYSCLSALASTVLAHTHTERNPQTASLAAAASSQEDSFLLPCHVNVLQAFPVHITMTTSPLLANIHTHTHTKTHTHTPFHSIFLSLSLSSSHPSQSQLFALQ